MACVHFAHCAHSISTASSPARQLISAAICGACVPADCPAQRVRAHAALHRPPGYTGGYGHPAAADAAASALRALRRAALATRRRAPPALRVLPDVPCLSAAHTVAASRSAVCWPCRALFSPVVVVGVPLLSCGCCQSPMSAGAGPAVFPDMLWA